MNEVHLLQSCISENLPFFSLRDTTHVQINHAETSAVKTIPVLMKEHAPSCATTPNKSSTAHARLDTLEDCEKKSPTSCKQLQLEAKKPKNSTVYTLYDPASKSFYQTFCHFTSETGFVWTLIESFSLANNNHFKAHPFLKDYPVSQNSLKWNKFLLSLPIMNSTLSHSTHFRATCNFNTNGRVTTDYLRAKTSDLNILQLSSLSCVKMEYINVRGYDCYDCTALMIQGINWHLHTDSSLKACQFQSASNGSVKSEGGEDNFGYYGTFNTLHRCTSGDNATTQWWFGEQ